MMIAEIMAGLGLLIFAGFVISEERRKRKEPEPDREKARKPRCGALIAGMPCGRIATRTHLGYPRCQEHAKF